MTLAHESHGTGDPPLLLVHGFPFTSGMWRPQIDALSKSRRVIAPDLPGFGRTPGAAKSMDAYAAGLRELLDELSVQRVILTGFSMGGYVAFAFLRLYAERVAGLILADTKAAADTDEQKQGRYAMAERAQSEGKQIVIAAMLPRLVTPATLADRPGVVQAVRDVEAGATLEGIVGALTAMAERPSSLGDLPRIAVPTLIIVGADDPITPPADAEQMASAIPNADLVTIPNAAHITTLEQPEAVTAAIKDWLANHTF